MQLRYVDIYSCMYCGPRGMPHSIQWVQSVLVCSNTCIISAVSIVGIGICPIVPSGYLYVFEHIQQLQYVDIYICSLIVTHLGYT